MKFTLILFTENKGKLSSMMNELLVVTANCTDKNALRTAVVHIKSAITMVQAVNNPNIECYTYYKKTLDQI